jgi:hypothetical protein
MFMLCLLSIRSTGGRWGQLESINQGVYLFRVLYLSYLSLNDDFKIQLDEPEFVLVETLIHQVEP